MQLLFDIIIYALPFITFFGSIGLDIAAFIHMSRRHQEHPIVWSFIIFFAPIIGAGGYLIINRES